jgi:flagellar biosynthesis protein
MDKHRTAVALTYTPEDAAPRVVAKGQGYVAQSIIERAREAGVCIHESEDLTRMLMKLDIDQRIPPELYRAIADLLAWVYALEKRAAKKAAAS